MHLDRLKRLHAVDDRCSAFRLRPKVWIPLLEYTSPKYSLLGCATPRFQCNTPAYCVGQAPEALPSISAATYHAASNIVATCARSRMSQEHHDWVQSIVTYDFCHLHLCCPQIRPAAKYDRSVPHSNRLLPCQKYGPYTKL